jgi:FkbM family methyltransferase
MIKNKVMEKSLKLNLREGTYDAEIYGEKDYDNCNFSKDDIWLDAGGNIGAFGLKYNDLVDQIISYEPEEDNYQIMSEHYRINNITNVECVQAALVENYDDTRTFYLNKKTNKGIHSFYVRRGRDKVDVKCENFNDAVLRWNVNKIKMDIEGGEYDLLMNFKHWDRIDEIVYEWHRKHLGDFENTRFNELAEHIRNQGFNVSHPPVKGNWATIVHVTK